MQATAISISVRSCLALRFRRTSGAALGTRVYAMRVLVTGSSGHIRSAVAARFARQSIVIGVDIRPGRYTTHIGSIEDARFLDTVVQGVDVIAHTAGLHAPHVGRRSDQDFIQTNVEGTNCLLDAAMQAGVGRFVMTSTTSIYGCTSRATDRALWVTEKLDPNPEDIYDETKLEAENMCRQAAHSGLTTVVLRMSRSFPEPENLLAFYRLYRGVDRRDVAEGHFAAATAMVRGFGLFNLSSESPFEQRDCERLWNDTWNFIDERVPFGRKAFNQMAWERPSRIDRVYVIEKAKQALGFSPECGFHRFVEERLAQQSDRKRRR